MNLETLIEASSLIEKQGIEIAKLKENLIKSCQGYRAFFEAMWDHDDDIPSEYECDHYRWVIKQLIESGGSINKHYLIKINDKEDELHF